MFNLMIVDNSTLCNFLLVEQTFIYSFLTYCIMPLNFRLLLLVLLPGSLLAQTVSPTNTHHAEALQQMQQYYPQATLVDVAQLQADQVNDHKRCSSCAKQQRPSTTTSNTSLASYEQLLAERERLTQLLQHLQDAGSTDRALIQKYNTALNRNHAQLRQTIQYKRKAAQKPAR